MGKIIRWGIAGPGIIANKFAEAVANVDGAQLVAVASRDAERGRKFADEHGISVVYTGYEEMAASAEIDAVYVATIHPFHKPCAEMFMNSGKHVLCEKPICINSAQAAELARCAEENGVFLMEAMWTRFLPAVCEAVNIARSGEIGKIRGVSADFCYSCLPEEDPKLYSNDLAGGALLDVGIYGLTLASLVLGDEPERVVAVADIKNGVDCQTNILMKYTGGETASVSAAINTLKPQTGYIYGTDGYIEIPTFYGAQELTVNVGGVVRNISSPSIGDGFEEEIYEACDCIRAGKLQSDIMPMTESIRMLELMDDIRSQLGVKYPYDM